MLQLCIGDLARFLHADVRLASMPPRDGLYQHVERIVLDSSAVREGDLFWGLRIDDYDGTELCELALSRGATGAVAAGRAVIPWAGRYVLTVPDTLQALLRLARVCPRAVQRKLCVGESPALVAELLAGKTCRLGQLGKTLKQNSRVVAA